MCMHILVTALWDSWDIQYLHMINLCFLLSINAHLSSFHASVQKDTGVAVGIDQVLVNLVQVIVFQEEETTIEQIDYD